MTSIRLFVKSFNKGQVQVSQQSVGCDSGASFSAHPCRCSFEGARFDVNILLLDLWFVRKFPIENRGWIVDFKIVHAGVTRNVTSWLAIFTMVYFQTFDLKGCFKRVVLGNSPNCMIFSKRGKSGCKNNRTTLWLQKTMRVSDCNCFRCSF